MLPWAAVLAPWAVWLLAAGFKALLLRALAALQLARFRRMSILSSMPAEARLKLLPRLPKLHSPCPGALLLLLDVLSFLARLAAQRQASFPLTKVKVLQARSAEV